jgi:hypothetical protein
VKRLIIPVIAVLLLAGVIVACKQGKGDRCQVSSDCTDGLECSKATNVCQGSAGGGLDANVPDAPIDAPDAL